VAQFEMEARQETARILAHLSVMNRIAVFLLMASLCTCGRPPADNPARSAETQNLPFDSQPQAAGVSPSQSLVPSATILPEGTPIAVRLESALSSASSHAGDTFYAFVDEPIMIDGQALVAPGVVATGRVLEAKASSRQSARGDSHQSPLEPGYLRIALVSLNVEGRRVGIETTSIFAKGGAREERSPATRASSGVARTGKIGDIELGGDRHLSFRLAQAVELR